MNRYEYSPFFSRPPPTTLFYTYTNTHQTHKLYLLIPYIFFSCLLPNGRSLISPVLYCFLVQYENYLQFPPFSLSCFILYRKQLKNFSCITIEIGRKVQVLIALLLAIVLFDNDLLSFMFPFNLLTTFVYDNIVSHKKGNKRARGVFHVHILKYNCGISF